MVSAYLMVAFLRSRRHVKAHCVQHHLLIPYTRLCIWMLMTSSVKGQHMMSRSHLGHVVDHFDFPARKHRQQRHQERRIDREKSAPLLNLSCGACEADM